MWNKTIKSFTQKNMCETKQQKVSHRKAYVKQNNKKFHIKECVWNKTIKCFTQKNMWNKTIKCFTQKEYVKQNNKKFHI